MYPICDKHKSGWSTCRTLWMPVAQILPKTWVLNFLCMQKKTKYSTNPVAVIADFDNQVVLSEIPDWGFSTGAGWGQDVLNLFVPCNTADVLWGLKQQRQLTTENLWYFSNKSYGLKSAVCGCLDSSALVSMYYTAGDILVRPYNAKGYCRSKK